jgi:hypothetical protein
VGDRAEREWVIALGASQEAEVLAGFESVDDDEDESDFELLLSDELEPPSDELEPPSDDDELVEDSLFSFASRARRLVP